MPVETQAHLMFVSMYTDGVKGDRILKNMYGRAYLCRFL